MSDWASDLSLAGRCTKELKVKGESCTLPSASLLPVSPGAPSLGGLPEPLRFSDLPSSVFCVCYMYFPFCNMLRTCQTWAVFGFHMAWKPHAGKGWVCIPILSLLPACVALLLSVEVGWHNSDGLPFPQHWAMDIKFREPILIQRLSLTQPEEGNLILLTSNHFL